MIARVLSFLVLSCLFSRCTLGCEEITVLYDDAKYMLVDGDTLDVVDVGDLRWQGVWGVDLVVPGSTLERFAVMANELSAGRGALGEDHSSKVGLVTWQNLAEQEDTASRVAVSYDYEIFRSFHARWIQGTNRLAVWEQKASKLSIVDVSLERIAAWVVPGHDIGETFACHGEDGVIVGGHRHRTRLEPRGMSIERLELPEGPPACEMSGPFLGCLGGFECQREGKVVNGVLDLARNEVVFEFAYGSRFTIPKDSAHSRPFAEFENRLLFLDGSRMLQQEVVWTPLWPGTNAYEPKPTSRLRVLDLAEGRIAAENDDAPVGTTSALLCAGERERVVVSRNGRAHLIDLMTLDTLASGSIPLGRHFVF